MTNDHHNPSSRPGMRLEISDPTVIGQIIDRASAPDFDRWWAQLAGSGFCASPVHLASDTSRAGPTEVMGRCKNRRAAVCPSCSQLYAGDTWQLVHAGIAGGHHGLPATISAHPMVFATLTAPTYGPVHTRSIGLAGETPRSCHPLRIGQRCGHGRPVGCLARHDDDDDRVGQPICGDCYDYAGHVLFTWHAPELWHRFTIRLRRLVASRLRQLGEDPKSIRISYVKVVELQRRAIPHFHTVIRLDDIGAPESPPAVPATRITIEALVTAVTHAAADVRLTVPGPAGTVTLRFGPQSDVQPLRATPDTTDQMTPDGLPGRRVAAYLAKYVTKSVADFGLAARRISDQAIADLTVTDHVRRILHTIVQLADLPNHHHMVNWLHTLGYRGHVTSKTRRYSTTMAALLAQRETWRRQHQTAGGPSAATGSSDVEPGDWHFVGYGHPNAGDRLLALSAAACVAEMRHVARAELAEGCEEAP